MSVLESGCEKLKSGYSAMLWFLAVRCNTARHDDDDVTKQVEKNGATLLRKGVIDASNENSGRSALDYSRRFHEHEARGSSPS